MRPHEGEQVSQPKSAPAASFQFPTLSIYDLSRRCPLGPSPVFCMAAGGWHPAGSQPDGSPSRMIYGEVMGRFIIGAAPKQNGFFTTAYLIRRYTASPGGRR